MRRAAVAALAATVACSPVTTRPPFGPLPRAATVVLAAEPPLVATAAAAWLRDRGISLERASEADRYIETAWYAPPPDSARPGATAAPPQVKTRIWADPAGPGRTRLTVETVYRQVEDPSRTPRDLELVVLPGTPGHGLADQLIAALTTRFGAL